MKLLAWIAIALLVVFVLPQLACAQAPPVDAAFIYWGDGITHAADSIILQHESENIQGFLNQLAQGTISGSGSCMQYPYSPFACPNPGTTAGFCNQNLLNGPACILYLWAPVLGFQNQKPPPAIPVGSFSMNGASGVSYTAEAGGFNIQLNAASISLTMPIQRAVIGDVPMPNNEGYGYYCHEYEQVSMPSITLAWQFGVTMNGQGGGFYTVAGSQIQGFQMPDPVCHDFGTHSGDISCTWDTTNAPQWSATVASCILNAFNTQIPSSNAPQNYFSTLLSTIPQPCAFSLVDGTTTTAVATQRADGTCPSESAASLLNSLVNVPGPSSEFLMAITLAGASPPTTFAPPPSLSVPCTPLLPTTATADWTVNFQYSASCVVGLQQTSGYGFVLTIAAPMSVQIATSESHGENAHKVQQQQPLHRETPRVQQHAKPSRIRGNRLGDVFVPQEGGVAQRRAQSPTHDTAAPSSAPSPVQQWPGVSRLSRALLNSVVAQVTTDVSSILKDVPPVAREGDSLLGVGEYCTVNLAAASWKALPSTFDIVITNMTDGTNAAANVIVQVPGLTGLAVVANFVVECVVSVPMTGAGSLTLSSSGTVEYTIGAAPYLFVATVVVGSDGTASWTAPLPPVTYAVQYDGAASLFDAWVQDYFQQRTSEFGDKVTRKFAAHAGARSIGHVISRAVIDTVSVFTPPYGTVSAATSVKEFGADSALVFTYGGATPGDTMPPYSAVVPPSAAPKAPTAATIVAGILPAPSFSVPTTCSVYGPCTNDGGPLFMNSVVLSVPGCIACVTVLGNVTYVGIGLNLTAQVEPMAAKARTVQKVHKASQDRKQRVGKTAIHVARAQDTKRHVKAPKAATRNSTIVFDGAAVSALFSQSTNVWNKINNELLPQTMVYHPAADRLPVSGVESWCNIELNSLRWDGYYAVTPTVVHVTAVPSSTADYEVILTLALEGMKTQIASFPASMSSLTCQGDVHVHNNHIFYQNTYGTYSGTIGFAEPPVVNVSVKVDLYGGVQTTVSSMTAATVSIAYSYANGATFAFDNFVGHYMQDDVTRNATAQVNTALAELGALLATTTSGYLAALTGVTAVFPVADGTALGVASGGGAPRRGACAPTSVPPGGVRYVITQGPQVAVVSPNEHFAGRSFITQCAGPFKHVMLTECSTRSVTCDEIVYVDVNATAPAS